MTITMDVDTILSTFIRHHIKYALGDMTITKMEKRIFEKYGLTLTQAIRDFSKFDHVLKEFFGTSAAKGMVENLLAKLFEIKFTKNRCVVEIKDESFETSLWKTIGTADKKKILDSIADTSKTISEILKELSINEPTGYRLFNQLQDDGFVIIDGFEKKKPQYVSLTSFLTVSLKGKNTLITLEVDSKLAKKSTILNYVSR